MSIHFHHNRTPGTLRHCNTSMGGSQPVTVLKQPGELLVLSTN